jgi:hypothetical protein
MTIMKVTIKNVSKMKTNHYLAALLLTAAVPSLAFAQKDSTMNRTVVVENQYNPYLMEATKLNLYPAVEEPKATARSFDYARSVRPVSDWGRNEMPLLSPYSPEVQPKRGCAWLSYGLRGRVDAGAAYTWDLTDNDRLAAGVRLDGWDGKRDDWTSRMYRTQAHLDYRHRFEQYEFRVGAGWKNEVFNYLPNPFAETPGYPYQRFSEGDFHVAVNTTDKELPLQFTLQTGLRTFLVAHDLNYGEGYTDGDDVIGDYENIPRITEKQVHTVGDLWAPINETQRVGVSFTMDNTFYSVNEKKYLTENPMDNFTAIGLNPYFAYEDADWRIRLGVHVDPLLGGPDKGLDVAPDIRLERVFNANSVLYLQAEGGREVNDFRRLTAITPYTNIPKEVVPTYVRLNTMLGFKISPVPGLWFHVFGGYQIRDHELFATLHEGAPYVYPAFTQLKGKVGLGGAEVKYAYKDVFDVTAKATAYSWSLDKEVNEAIYLAYKPRYEWSLEAQGKVMDGLKIQAGFEYTDRRKDGDTAVQNLYTGASYALVHDLTVFARVNNILNKEYLDRNLYPAEKLGFIVGLGWKF